MPPGFAPPPVGVVPELIVPEVDIVIVELAEDSSADA
jgi:hypothetical protein